MTSATEMLVRTPAQFAQESPLGFVLRVSQLNGYTTPRHVFELAGISTGQMLGLRLNMTRLAAALGRAGNELRGYLVDRGGAALGVALCGHLVPEGEVRTSRPACCPECVQELGFIPAWMDLAFVDACPYHRRRLVDFCKSCERPLSWLRPGLLTCRCGAKLGESLGAAISDEHAQLLGHLLTKFTGRAVDDVAGMPVAQLEAMTPARLIAMSKCLALMHATALGGANGSESQRAASMYRHWPSRLHAALRLLSPASTGDSGAVQMRRHAAGVYRTLLKNVRVADDVAFLRQALGAYSSSSAEVVGSNDSPSVLASLAEQPARAIRRLRKFQPLAVPRRRSTCAAPGRGSLGARDAARRLGLPVSALVHLRMSGHFEVRHAGTRGARYHEADIAAFEEKVSQVCAEGDGRTGATRSLRWAFTQKFRHASGKGELVAAVLEGQVDVLRREGPTISDLVVDAEQVEAFMRVTRAAAFAGALTPREVADELQCDATAVASLLLMGYLTGHDCSTGRRIEPSSVAQFRCSYRSLVDVAAQRGVHSRTLMRQAAAAGVELLMAERGQGISPQPFVRVDDIDRLSDVAYETRQASNERRRQQQVQCPSVTVQAAAQALQCTPTVVPRLCATGHLVRCDSGARAGVTKASLDNFLSRYRSLVGVAKVRGVGPTRLINEAATAGIDLLAVARGSVGSPQYFIRVEDAERLGGP